MQIGTAFLVTEESAAAPAHKELLLDGRGGHTRLTRAFTGRLARGIVNRAMDELAAGRPAVPVPGLPGAAAAPRPRGSRAGPTSPRCGPVRHANLVRHRHAADLLDALIDG